MLRRGRCFAHRTRKSHTWCLKECGRATQSRTGYCSHCGWAQNDHGHKMKRQEREMDALIDVILSWDWGVTHVDQCRTTTTPLTAECVRSG
jgi:ribosomal protein L37E